MKRIISKFPEDWDELGDIVEARWLKRQLPFSITIKKAPKTAEQLGYLHKIVLPRLATALFDNGDTKSKSEDEAKYWLKMTINYGTWYEFNERPVFASFSFEDADIDILIKAIDTAIFEAAERKVYIPPPRKKGNI